MSIFLRRPIFSFSPSLLFVCGCIAAALCANRTLLAQSDTLPHTLLWRIDGNGAASPSYLFGTFHTQDPRAFDFRDSVLPALLSCDIAAFELQLDSTSAEMLERLYRPDSVLDLREYLSDEEFAVLDQRIAAETGLSGESLRYADPSFLLLMIDQPAEIAYDNWESDADKNEGEDESPLMRATRIRMPKETFLDAWLFRTAQLEGKRVTGLETIAEQIAVSDTIPLRERIRMLVQSITVNVGEQARLQEKMLELYRQENLNGLIGVVEDEEVNSGLLFKLLTERNRTMADRIVRLMEQGSVFTAVGAGHLPGREGLIALLRARGFNVTPVLSDRTGVAAGYKRPARELPWYRLVDSARGFGVETPIPTVEIPLESYIRESAYTVAGTNIPMMHYRFITDITTGLNYFLIEVDVPLATMLSQNPFVSARESSFGDGSGTTLESLLGSGSGMVMRSKDVEADGVAGKEFTGIDNDGDLTRMRVFRRGGRVYTFMVSGGTAVIKTRDDTRFLKSVSFLPLPPADWKHRFAFDGTIAGALPAPPYYDTARTWSIGGRGLAVTRTATSVDPATGIYYIAEQTTLSPGTTSVNDSVLLREMAERGIPVDSVTEEEREELPAEGKARRTSLNRFSFASGATMTRKVQLRGGYVWSATVARPEGASDPEGEERFFRSIVTVAPVVGKGTFTDREQGFQAGLSTPLIDSSDFSHYSGKKRFEAGQWVGDRADLVAVETYSPYYEAENEEQFFETLRSDIAGNGDSLGDERRVTAAGLDWLEYTVTIADAESETQRKYRERVALHGARLYRLRRFSLDPDYDFADAEAFFNSFRLTDPTPHGNVFTRKVDVLLRDISSEDSAVRAVALASLWYYPFRQEDLPKLYDAMERDYPPMPSEYDQPTESRLAGALRSVNDDRSVKALRKLYRRLPPDHDARSTILDVLGAIRTDESLEAFSELLKEDPPSDSYGYSIFSSFYGNLQGIEKLYPDMMRLIDRPTMRSTIFSLTNSALDSGTITLRQIESEEKRIREAALASIEQYRTPSYMLDENTEAIYPWEAEITITLLGKLSAEKETDDILKRTLRDTNLNVRRASAVALLRHGLEVREKWLNDVAADRLERLNLYRDLTGAGLGERFPKEYASQTYLAESMISESLYWSEEYPPEQVEYVADRIVEWNGEPMRGYLYKFRYQWYGGEEEEKWGPWYPALCIQPDDPDRLNPDTDLVRISWDEFNPEEIDRLFAELPYQTEPKYGE